LFVSADLYDGEDRSNTVGEVLFFLKDPAMPTLINKKSKRTSTFYMLKMRYTTQPKPCGAYYITNYSLRIESTIGGLGLTPC